MRAVSMVFFTYSFSFKTLCRSCRQDVKRNITEESTIKDSSQCARRIEIMKAEWFQMLARIERFDFYASQIEEMITNDTTRS
mmetsp:Transcript_3232/g.4301  ORF Transcript_3232/g.4301 Transcript_3232/m.4301 type:complete len:82 (-) Transcript_3232:2908-3153(-)